MLAYNLEKEVIDMKSVKDICAEVGIEFNPHDLRPVFFYNGDCGPLKYPLHLEPCPCCGGMPMMGLRKMIAKWGWYVRCKDCGLQTPPEAIDWPSLMPAGEDGVARVDESTRYTSTQAAERVIGKWNRRPAVAI